MSSDAPGSPQKVDALRGKLDYELSYALEKWYDVLSEYTSETAFLSVSELVTEKLFRCCCSRDADEKAKLMSEPQLQRLVEEIDSIIRGKFADSGCFVKLSTRSPKDVFQDLKTPYGQQLKAQMQHRLDSDLDPSLSPQMIANQDTVAFCDAVRRMFRVDSGEDALKMLVYSTRIRSDLNKLVDHNMSSLLVIRSFSVCRTVGEFRGFIYNRKLTAVSQYAYFQFFPELLERKDEIAVTLQQFFQEHVLEKLPFDKAIVDFHLDFDTNAVSLIEFNPFFNDTGACMFDWKSEKDKKIIGGELPFEIRVLEKCVDNPFECLPWAWRVFFEDARAAQQEAEKKCILQ